MDAYVTQPMRDLFSDSVLTLMRICFLDDSRTEEVKELFQLQREIFVRSCGEGTGADMVLWVFPLHLFSLKKIIAWKQDFFPLEDAPALAVTCDLKGASFYLWHLLFLEKTKIMFTIVTSKNADNNSKLKTKRKHINNTHKKAHHSYKYMCVIHLWSIDAAKKMTT